MGILEDIALQAQLRSNAQSSGGRPGAVFGILQDVQLGCFTMASPKIFDTMVVRGMRPTTGGIFATILNQMGFNAQGADGFKQAAQGAPAYQQGISAGVQPGNPFQGMSLPQMPSMSFGGGDFIGNGLSAIGDALGGLLRGR